MNNIKVLDCTLRDGGRIIDCVFQDSVISDISNRLADAKIDIIEMGFLRDWRSVEYRGNSTFFTSVEQIRPFIKNRKYGTLYVAFVDYGMFDFDSLSKHDGTSIDGIRVGFTKKNYISDRDGVINALKLVKEKGYKLFIQGVNSLGYSDFELLEIVEMVNEIQPYSFGIVDTYGAMYVDDVRRIYSLVDHNLSDSIYIDFHSHNNFQLSFALAQEVIALSNGTRNIIIDSTLNGMGKCAGNLNTELIVDYLVRKKKYNYDWDMLLDIIDDHMYGIKENNFWGFSIPSMIAGIYKTHPNNVIYLTEKYRLATKDIKYILSMIDPDLRNRYDYNYIHKLYQEYNHTKVDDKYIIDKLEQMLSDRNILLLLPGSSIIKYRQQIIEYVREKNAMVISVNFISDIADSDNRISFFGSEKRYKKALNKSQEKNIIVVSNIREYASSDMVVNYESIIERDNVYFDNTMIMLLNLLYRIGICKFAIAGFDGYCDEGNNYCDNNIFDHRRFEKEYKSITENMILMLKKYAQRVETKNNIKFLTPSIYSKIFED